MDNGVLDLSAAAKTVQGDVGDVFPQAHSQAAVGPVRVKTEDRSAVFLIDEHVALGVLVRAGCVGEKQRRQRRAGGSLLIVQQPVRSARRAEAIPHAAAALEQRAQVLPYLFLIRVRKSKIQIGLLALVGRERSVPVFHSAVISFSEKKFGL